MRTPIKEFLHSEIMPSKSSLTACMKIFIHCILLMIINAHCCFAQWSTLNVPIGGRYDDVFFINDTIGWAVAGNAADIYITTDGGINWTLQLDTDSYLRSIEFASPTLGFCGSLDSSFYKTTDGGQTWIDISNTITPKPPGICGLSAPTTNVIYGCGIWSSPAYVIKSADGGNVWQTIDLSSFASALVDIHFINADTGFVSGMANPASDGGIILSTKDGGNSWTVVHKTLIAYDYVWKLQSPDGIHFYGSIEALPVTANVRMLKSSDAGDNWNTLIVDSQYNYIQTIGFIDTLRGWTGGYSTLFETNDGGSSWTKIEVGNSYNRFFKINDSTAFLTGAGVYKYSKNSTSSIKLESIDDIHSLNIFPIPVNKILNVNLTIKNKTNCLLLLISSSGQIIQPLYNGPIEMGEKKFSISLENLPSQIYYLVLKTNEGNIFKEIIK